MKKDTSLQAQETDVLNRIERDVATGIDQLSDPVTALKAEALIERDPGFEQREYATVQKAQNEWDAAHPGQFNPATGLTGPYVAGPDALPELDDDDDC